jgi:hypothetical protein
MYNDVIMRISEWWMVTTEWWYIRVVDDRGGTNKGINSCLITLMGGLERKEGCKEGG